MSKPLRSLLILAMSIGVALAPTAASAKKSTAKKPRPAATKMTIALDASDVLEGEAVDGTVILRTRSGRAWVPVAGASLAVTLDAVAQDAVTTGSDGSAEVSFTGSGLGEHVVRFNYAGDSTHKRAKRSRGFTVLGTWYADVDGDSYGDDSVTTDAAEQPDGYADAGGDCNDADAAVNPGATEDGSNLVDDDCDGDIDEAS